MIQRTLRSAGATILALITAMAVFGLFPALIGEYDGALQLSGTLRFLPLILASTAFAVAVLTSPVTDTPHGLRLLGYASLGMVAGGGLLSALAGNIALLALAATVTGVGSGMTVRAAHTVLNAQYDRRRLWLVYFGAAAVSLFLVAGALAILPVYEWRGVFGLGVLAAGMSAWAYAANVKPIPRNVVTRAA
ncbi:hypothetical protein [Haloglycomyces albus]|uniref:hypothetical protein n=1 Tax=Haloglycomyces albus TaxID=526067 RepID=UPI00046D0E0E|nr:hypothetical protein [Haloglycomyces albus]